MMTDLTRAEALATTAKRLATVSATPRLDAELLMAHAGATTREALLLSGLRMPVPGGLEALVQRRLRHEPVAYITGHRAFWSIDLRVSYGVLVPRPDSETLIEAAVEHFRGTPGPRTVIDLGTGSGALLLAALAEWPEATGVGVEASAAARRIAAGNVRALDMAGRAEIVAGGWEGQGRHDLVLCNPPYIAKGTLLPREVAAWEPHEALFAGEDGLDDYRRLAPLLGPQIAPGGLACIEVGAGQAADVRMLFEAEGLRVGTRRDLAGWERCLVVTPGDDLG